MNTIIIIDSTIMMALSDESQEKVVNIYHIASMLKHHNAPPLTWGDFVQLYDSPLSVLESHTNTRAHQLGIPAPDLKIRENHPAARPQQREYPEDPD